MADTKPNTPTQTTSGGQNTIVIVLLALLILVGILVILNINDQSQPGSADDKLSALKQRVEEQEREMREQGYNIPENHESLDELADKISKDALTLKESAYNLQKSLSDKDRELRQLRAELEASITINERHGAESTKLRNQLSQVQSQQGQVTFLKQQISDLSAQLAHKDQQIAELGSRPEDSQFTEISKELNNALLRNKDLETKVAELTALKNTMISPSEVQSLKDQLAKLKPENETLKLTLQQLRAEIDRERLYVQSADKLLPAAAKLYRELEKLDDLNEDQLKSAYTRIGEQLKARVVKSVQFETGKSTVGFADQADIRDRLADINPDADILIVGYASKTGDEDQNRELSARRSATTASVVHHLLEQKGNVHAVYLGQTGRFSATAGENQICEIWEIRK
ncbi:OmpA family protein [Rubritalea squalenifaciens DSM 18772]|uniref:OmpA family protein n=1 Tax=Rubritalea squalenifaciens DSM 18772 TaxID=1123071 RepID=A0A1M6I5D3_9BACT|nr:OmpA family protein [Rubritalea squalenifaciens]SHJ29661.1 OmpA family protein [Rubritalea squalenifaciens DSM 18772]